MSEAAIRQPESDDCQTAPSNVIPFPHPIPEGAHRTNDAIVWGDLDDEILDRKIKVAVSSSIESFQWKNVETDFLEFLQSITVHKLQPKKDGNAFTQGAIEGADSKNGASRRQTAISALDLMVIDLDTGQDAAELLDNIRKQGWFAVVATSFSHMKPITAVKRDDIVKRFKEDREPTLQDVLDFLLNEKNYQPHILADAELINAKKNTPDGIMMEVRHLPMPKMRIILLLKYRFVIADRITGRKKLQDVANEWRQKYAAVSGMIGAYYDRSCSDLNRGFYFPSHPKTSTDWRIDVLPGVLLDLDQIKVADDNPFATAGAAMGAGRGGNDKDPKGKLFFKLHGAVAELDQFFLTLDPDGDVKPRNNGGRTHKCPFVGNHTVDPGKTEDNDTGFYCVDAIDSDTGQAVARCMHDGCKSKYDRIDYVKAILDREGKTWADMGEFVPLTLEGEPAFDRSLFEDDASDKPATNGYEHWSEAAWAGVPANQRPSLDAFTQAFHKFHGFVASGEGGKYITFNDDGHSIDFTGRGGFEVNNAHVRVELDAKGKDKKATLAPFLKLWPTTGESVARKFTGLTFRPGKTQDEAFPRLNTWRSLGVNPVAYPGDWEQSLTRRHIWEVMADETQEKYDIIIGWMARHVKTFGDLDKKFPLSLVFRSTEEGVGKSLFWELIYAPIFGRHGIVLAKPDDVTSNFNSLMGEALFTLLEEAVYAKNPAIVGRVKHLLSGHTLTLERKGLDKVIVPNFSQYVFASNEELPVPFTQDSRRFAVFQCNPRYVNQKKSYFDPLLAEIKAGASSHLLHYLQGYQPKDGWDFLYQSHQSAETDEMLALTLRPFERFIIGKVVDADDKAYAEGLNFRTDTETTYTMVNVIDAFTVSDEVRHAQRHERGDGDTDRVCLGMLLAKILPSSKSEVVNRQRVRVFPSQAQLLDDLRTNAHRGYRQYLTRLESGEPATA